MFEFGMDGAGSSHRGAITLLKNIPNVMMIGIDSYKERIPVIFKSENG